jgi:hypothetical protein
MQIVVNCETCRCSQFLGPGDNFSQSYRAIFTDRAATGSGSLMDPMSTVDRMRLCTAVLLLNLVLVLPMH